MPPGSDYVYLVVFSLPPLFLRVMEGKGEGGPGAEGAGDVTHIAHRTGNVPIHAIVTETAASLFGDAESRSRTEIKLIERQHSLDIRQPFGQAHSLGFG